MDHPDWGALPKLPPPGAGPSPTPAPVRALGPGAPVWHGRAQPGSASGGTAPWPPPRTGRGQGGAGRARTGRGQGAGSGRPYAVGRFAATASAMVQVFLPDEEGGRAVAQLLSGRANFSGKLPVQIPNLPGGQPPYTYLHPPLGDRQSFPVQPRSDARVPVRTPAVVHELRHRPARRRP
ncbi:glycoside hydrolase family 3 C-terminal domain-containing protein [Streptomyces sp. NPDC000878]